MTDPNPSDAPIRGLTARQKRALNIVGAASTLIEGCKLAGISKTTWWTWKQQPAFRKAVEARDDAAFKESMGRLKARLLLAVDRLSELLNDKDKYVRLQAASLILNHGRRAAETYDLAKRIEALEGKLQ